MIITRAASGERNSHQSTEFIIILPEHIVALLILILKRIFALFI